VLVQGRPGALHLGGTPVRIRIALPVALVLFVTVAAASGVTAREEPLTAEVLLAIGNEWYSVEQFDRAIEFYSKAIEVDPKFAPSYLARA
jgi:tetratricopeptide (TPR) repeat protein